MANLKRQIRVVPILLKNLKAVAVRLQSKVSDDKNSANTRVYNWKSAKPYAANNIVQQHLTGTPMKWAVWVGILCVDPFGKQYMQGEWIVANQHYYFDKLADLIGDEFESLYKTANKNQVVDAGWIAVPWQQELPDETVMAIFEHYGAWEDGKV